ncbi:MAG: PilZ domain-containing protein [Planctomycetes bacterium]|nr:PilZ domain-containing protein [Planctomycetota bacterium]
MFTSNDSAQAIAHSEIAPGAALVEERRTEPRIVVELPTKITLVGGAEEIDCTTHNVTECGMFIRANSAAGLCVGQRCEVRIVDASTAPGLESLVNETNYATVIHTEPADAGGRPSAFFDALDHADLEDMAQTLLFNISAMSAERAAAAKILVRLRGGKVVDDFIVLAKKQEVTPDHLRQALADLLSSKPDYGQAGATLPIRWFTEPESLAVMYPFRFTSY